ncbi:MAG: HXXEE domain-containing protein [Devosia sp.]
MWLHLKQSWVYGGSLAGVMVLCLMPIIGQGWPLALTLVFLQLPIYIFHQLEEHYDDRFRRVVNDLIGQGREVLSLGGVFVINMAGVWALDLISFGLAYRLGIGWGLIGAYAMVINAVAHIVQGIRLRSYNPGLVTSIILFLPVGLGGIWAISATGEATGLQHVVGIAIGLALHAAIVGYVLNNRRRLTERKAT